ncbi:MAG: hypothetical protein C4332_11925 [Meiothermus sp.]
MYKLTVAEAHTFYVDIEQWLVHNQTTKYLTDTSVLVAAPKGDANAPALLKDNYITSGVLNDFLDVKTSAQRQALKPRYLSGVVQCP